MVGRQRTKRRRTSPSSSIDWRVVASSTSGYFERNITWRLSPTSCTHALEHGDDVVGRAEEDLRLALGDLLGGQLVGIPRGVLGRVEAVPVAVDPAGQQVAVGQRRPGRVAAVGVEEPADVERERRVVGGLAVAGQGVAVPPHRRLDTVEQTTVLAGPLLVRLRVRAGVHAVAVAQGGGSVDGVGMVATEHDRRAARPVRQRADDEAVALVVAAVELDGSARPRLATDLDQLDRAADALGGGGRRTPRTRCPGSRVRDRPRSDRPTARRGRRRPRPSGSGRAAAPRRGRGRR